VTLRKRITLKKDIVIPAGKKFLYHHDLGQADLHSVDCYINLAKGLGLKDEHGSDQVCILLNVSFKFHMSDKNDRKVFKDWFNE
jgi:hypothetical protein